MSISEPVSQNTCICDHEYQLGLPLKYSETTVGECLRLHNGSTSLKTNFLSTYEWDPGKVTYPQSSDSEKGLKMIALGSSRC